MLNCAKTKKIVIVDRHRGRQTQQLPPSSDIALVPSMKIDAFFRRSKRCGFCLPDLPWFNDQCVAADDKLLENILLYFGHTLHCLLPPPTVSCENYNLRSRTHNIILPKHTGQITDSNFLNRVYSWTHIDFIRIRIQSTCSIPSLTNVW